VGIYDRDYYRQSRRSAPFPYAPQSVVVALIVVNVVVWIVASFSRPTVIDPGTDAVLARWLSDQLATHVSTLTQPLYWWQFLTAGFAHAPDFQHVLFNMLVLYFLGRDIEDLYGPKEFLRLYLVLVVVANIVWCVVNKFAGSLPGAGAYGASGAITGIVVLYALNFPNRTLLLFFVIPMPAWLLGVLGVAYDIYGAMGGACPNVAYSVHLTGAAFALLYYQQRWNFTRWTEGWLRWPRLRWRGKPRLRVHRPEESDEELGPGLNREVDRILEKIGRQGEASLTTKERRTLETASREYRRKMARHE
jgi:membrane associated rhomboid family serine protease